MFHFPGFARSHLCIQCGVRRHCPPWVSPFGYPRIIAWLAAPRGFSQLPTSFFASYRLGIHRVPLVAWSSFSFLASLLLLEDQGPTRSVKTALTLNYIAYSFACAYALFKERTETDRSLKAG